MSTIGLLAAVPPLVVTLAALAIALGARAGADPISLGNARNLSEAAATANAGAVLRFQGVGMDPNRFYELRPGHLDHVRVATPLEAAVLSRQVEVVRLVERGGVLLDEPERAHLRCLAEDIKARDIAEHFSAGGAPATCADGEALERVRTRRPRQPAS